MNPSVTNRDFSQDLVFSASRSGGPGGQNVNKVNSKVELRFNIRDSSVLSELEKEKLISRIGHRINTKGEIVITSRSERSQARNKQQTLEKFYQLLMNSLKDKKIRIPTKPGITARIKRLESKKRIAEKKRWRKKDI